MGGAFLKWAQKMWNPLGLSITTTGTSYIYQNYSTLRQERCIMIYRRKVLEGMLPTLH